MTPLKVTEDSAFHISLSKSRGKKEFHYIRCSCIILSHVPVLFLREMIIETLVGKDRAQAIPTPSFEVNSLKMGLFVRIQGKCFSIDELYIC